MGVRIHCRYFEKRKKSPRGAKVKVLSRVEAPVPKTKMRIKGFSGGLTLNLPRIPAAVERIPSKQSSSVTANLNRGLALLRSVKVKGS